MYLHLGQDALVKTSDVIGIFDLDNTTVSKNTRDFLARAEKKGRVVNVAAYLSQISSSTLRKRTGFVEAISSPGHRPAASGTGRK